ncbi:hypothetical protein SAMN02745157_0575 [Kaistia soli DSM 19436]|uniref:Uncharacterized protein n=1 Tax=Kaistia soli DSM 19436 TaxID=1122133 RepID=A0A1M4V036_9HYPH|nr:hypothetical protein [Kaistia soli]SHE62257.1 hypothetical protein SAMN02745157_0575 [Kaistia soli DSM 19436]
MPKISEAVWASVRARFEGTIDPIVDIAHQHGMSHVALWRRAKRDGWVRPHQAPSVPLAAEDDKLLGRLFRAFERQVADLEQRFLAGGGSIEEKDARTLSVLARTFETLAKLRDEREGPVDEGSVDLDDLRARLAQRLSALDPRGLAASGADGADGGGVDRRRIRGAS